MNTVVIYTLVVSLSFGKSTFKLEDIATLQECQAMQADVMKTFSDNGETRVVARCYGYHRAIIEKPSSHPALSQQPRR